MAKKELSNTEVGQVSGGASRIARGVLPTKFALASPGASLAGGLKLGGIGPVAVTCQCVNCCSNHIQMEDLVVNPG